MIVKCSHCGVITTAKEFEGHECDLSFNESKIIKVAYFRNDSHKNKQIITGLGLDKVLYTFEVVPRTATPYFTSLSRRNVTNSEENNGTDGEVPEPFLPLYKGGIVSFKHLR